MSDYYMMPTLRLEIGSLKDNRHHLIDHAFEKHSSLDDRNVDVIRPLFATDVTDIDRGEWGMVPEILSRGFIAE